ncbi:MAG: UDP-N-acetylmuramate:L-alanyl-gamma-D-glutamyl-meso-diaminopimelate ligase [Candidatus Latescibacteria bacterium]|jgi:UDP-N-acetylmuramate: L-alanyl-gamma-D-glutamyl-meso-diaminopimelate ligase|nr:UDP-N-acetylmuramate:L-alanyl-gamma-D-glutamyl-meso-diaminopimelate ligase [Candidatus Latescibacterota bacterium]
MVAICGTAMAPLAVMLKRLGHHVTGSDTSVYPPMSTVLEEQGIPVREGFDSENLNPKPDLVIIGNAVSRGNPEAEAVLSDKIRYMSQSAALREFFLWDKRVIVVAGTHGKTTTTSLLAWLLDCAGLDPSFMIGGVPIGWESGARLGRGKHFIIEGDEYDSAFFDKRAKFLNYLPDIAVINNIEFDHADIYDSLDQIVLAFRRLINLIPSNGLLIAPSDDETVSSLLPDAQSPLETFGAATEGDWRAGSITVSPDGTSFDVFKRSELLGRLCFSSFGRHNVSNGLAAIAAASSVGLSWAQIEQGFRSFPGVKRRMEIRGVVNDVTIYDDFAHHPTAVRATIDSLREAYPSRTVWAVFEPRTATTIRRIFQTAYEEAFDGADHIILAPVFNPGKAPADDRFSLEELSSGLVRRGKDTRIMPGVDAIVSYLTDHARPGDQILFMSNGGFGGIHEKTLESLKSTSGPL